MTTRPVRVSKATKDRCAVVVGVNRTGGLVPLGGAVAGAKRIANLFSRNKYDVTLITDEKRPVTADQIARAIGKFISKQQQVGYRLLVVYFSGHGYWRNEGDLWLLSGAPENPNEAVSLKECVDLAQDSGVPNVVLISDACRSTPQGSSAARVRGRLVFPNLDIPDGRQSKVDQLMSSRKGAVSYEVPIGPNREAMSVFTHCLLRAYQSPDPGMVKNIRVDNAAIPVVPNRRLEAFLVREISDVLASIDISLGQEPAISIVSDDDIYMARVKRGVLVRSHPSHRSSVADEGAAKSLVELNDRLFNAALDGVPVTMEETESSNARDLLSDSLEADRYLSNPVLGQILGSLTSGFVVTGARIDDIGIMPSGRGREVFNVRSGHNFFNVELRGEKSASVLMVIESGRGIPLAVLAGYIGHVVIRDGIVRAISYIPAQAVRGDQAKPWRWNFYLQNERRLGQLRALALARLRNNGFRIGDSDVARRLARVLRDAKGIDPMLGLYATYAFHEGGRREEISSVSRYMFDNLDAEVFDVAMLASARGEWRAASQALTPFCPVLTQGWNYLRSRRVQLPLILEDAQDELVAGPYTTFKGRRTAAILKAIRYGQLSMEAQ